MCVCVSEWDNEEQFNGSPPRPQPRGPRTPPGPPPPDDDDEDALPVPGVCEISRMKLFACEQFCYSSYVIFFKCYFNSKCHIYLKKTERATFQAT